jgi:hypothetical protein
LPELLQENIEIIRTTYDGPLSVASDLYVYNITKDKITEPIKMSDFPNTGAWEKYVPPPMPDGK